MLRSISRIAIDVAAVHADVGCPLFLRRVEFAPKARRDWPLCQPLHIYILVLSLNLHQHMHSV